MCSSAIISICFFLTLIYVNKQEKKSYKSGLGQYWCQWFCIITSFIDTLTLCNIDAKKIIYPFMVYQLLLPQILIIIKVLHWLSQNLVLRVMWLATNYNGLLKYIVFYVFHIVLLPRKLFILHFLSQLFVKSITFWRSR